MNSRSNFHRTQQWQLAERQRYLSELEALGERVRADVERLREEIDEAGGAGALPSNKRYDPLFVRPLVDRQDKLMRSVAEIDAQIVGGAGGGGNGAAGGEADRGRARASRPQFEDRLTRRARRSI